MRICFLPCGSSPAVGSSKSKIEESKAILLKLIEKHNVGVISIGNCYGFSITKEGGADLVKQFFLSAGTSWLMLNVGSKIFTAIIQSSSAATGVVIIMVGLLYVNVSEGGPDISTRNQKKENVFGKANAAGG